MDTSGRTVYRTLPAIPKSPNLIAIKLQPSNFTIVVLSGCIYFGENLELWLPPGKVVCCLHCTTAFNNYELQCLTLSYGAVGIARNKW